MNKTTRFSDDQRFLVAYATWFVALLVVARSDEMPLLQFLAAGTAFLGAFYRYLFDKSVLDKTNFLTCKDILRSVAWGVFFSLLFCLIDYLQGKDNLIRSNVPMFVMVWSLIVGSIAAGIYLNYSKPHIQR